MNPLWEYLKSHPSSWIGIVLLLVAFINNRHAVKQQEAAWDMPDDTDTQKICRQLRLLETRIWVLGWWIIAAIGTILLFIG